MINREVCIICHIYRWFIHIVDGVFVIERHHSNNHVYLVRIRVNQLCVIYIIFKIDFLNLIINDILLFIFI